MLRENISYKVETRAGQAWMQDATERPIALGSGPEALSFSSHPWPGKQQAEDQKTILIVLPTQSSTN